MHNTSIGSNSHSGGSGNNNNFGFAVRHLPMVSRHAATKYTKLFSNIVKMTVLC